MRCHSVELLQDRAETLAFDGGAKAWRVRAGLVTGLRGKMRRGGGREKRIAQRARFGA